MFYCSHYSVYPLRLKRLQPPQDDLFQALFAALDSLKETFTLQNHDLLCISAKVVAIHQGRCRKIHDPAERRKLMQQEADYYIASSLAPDPEPGAAQLNIDFPFTIKDGTPVPFAGIDESNGDGWQILWPETPQHIAGELRKRIAQRYGVDSLGLLILDSTVLPMRRGCISLSIAAAGVQLLHSYQGEVDLFGRELKLSETNIVDRIAGFAGLHMGEGAEQTPVVVLRGLERFITEQQEATGFPRLFMEPEQDFYAPLFRQHGEQHLS
ncbi:bifunctional F420 biosynthesis protein FbiB-like [Saccostrea echinata]|uniref:bifunctional F420 biosynthesis protein FbiB-like n=1 Tax=Saccostrea echinata TaxID=191078 RepID=UPI002A812E72|nr:bifunctional F420 biosynthesis protein FbiB-like [Saccostrea echinata]